MVGEDDLQIFTELVRFLCKAANSATWLLASAPRDSIPYVQIGSTILS